MFEKMKDMGKLMKQAGEMKSKMKKVQEELKSLRVTGAAEGGKVQIVLTGELECVSITVDPSLTGTALTKALQKAFNDAAKQSKDLATTKLTEISGGLNLPGF